MVGCYIHIPFCKRRCDYCHFYVTRNSEKREALFLKALKREWEGKKHLTKGLKTLYFGGGNPFTS